MLPNKSCAADPVLTSVVKQLADDVSPFLTALVNRSLSECVVPAAFKTAFITPRLTKPDVDATDVRSFRPVFNLSVIYKLIEQLVARRLVKYLTANNLFPRLQSAYQLHHSAETAVVKVLADILLAIHRTRKSLLADVTSSNSLLTFSTKLKSHLFLTLLPQFPN